MKEQQKISIRFFDDREVRALWDEQNAQWWFSVLDIVAVLTDQDDYTKARNYWKYLKTKLRKENSEVVSATTQLKLLAPDGKKRLTDMLDYNGIISLGKQFPDKKANRFIEWFTYSGDSIDGKSKTDYMNAMVKSPGSSTVLKKLLKNALTDQIDSREMYMKGIDYSYYYEEN